MESCPQDVDDLFEKIEDARLQLRHSDARRLFGDEDETEKGSEDRSCCNLRTKCKLIQVESLALKLNSD